MTSSAKQVVVENSRDEHKIITIEFTGVTDLEVTITPADLEPEPQTPDAPADAGDISSFEPRKDAMNQTIQLTPAEIQSGHDRVQWAEGLILQLPAHHDGRNSWLLNYGTGDESNAIRAAHARGEHYGAKFKEPSSVAVSGPVRRDFRLSEADLTRLLDASKSVMYLVANGSEPMSPAEAAMRIWREIADREGVDVDTIRQGSDGNGHCTAMTKSAAA